MVGKYIKELLFDHDCVILPGFGGFLTQYVSADIHPITHKFQPPSKRVAFNEQLKNNDGLLVNAIASKEGISHEEALKGVNAFVSEIREKMSMIGIYELKDVGRFFYNRANLLEFEPDTSVNYLQDSYSLPELFFKPIDRNINYMNKVQKPVKPGKTRNTASEGQEEGEDKVVKRTNPALIILPIILLILGGATAFLYFNQDDKNLAGINPFVILGHQEEAKTETPVASEPATDTASVAETPSEEPIAESSTEPAPVAGSSADVITEKTGRYYVVAGSFKNKKNAMKLREKYTSQNISSSVIEPKGRKNFYRVTVGDFGSRREAKEKLGELKSAYGDNVWILSY